MRRFSKRSTWSTGNWFRPNSLFQCLEMERFGWLLVMQMVVLERKLWSNNLLRKSSKVRKMIFQFPCRALQTMHCVRLYKKRRLKSWKKLKAIRPSSRFKLMNIESDSNVMMKRWASKQFLSLTNWLMRFKGKRRKFTKCMIVPK